MTMGIPRELVEQFARGDGVVFVGAGLSQGAGLPGWSELLMPLADSISLPAHLRTDLLKVAQHYGNQRGRQALVSHVIEQTDTTGKRPTDNHRRLARLGARIWVTTNYDDLLEQTLREVGERFTTTVRDEDLPYTSADAVTLVKLHGDREQPDTIVITQQDYYTYFRRFPRVKDKLSGLLLEKTFLFVGYSINDPDFNQIQTEIAFDLQQHQRTAYAVLFDADEFTQSDLRSRNIHVLGTPTGGQANYSERLGALLDDLIGQVNRGRRQRVHELRPVIGAPTPPEVEDVRGLLEAMGYRITDTQALGTDLYFLCDVKWGAEIRQEVVHFVSTEPTAGDIAALNDAVISHGAARGTLLARRPLPVALFDLVRQRERIQCYTLDKFTNQLADFRPYLERLIQEYEASEIPQFYVPLAVESEAAEDRAPQVFKPLESFVDAWLSESGRNHLSILGDFGSGKTWFCQRYAYLTARRYLADPTRNRIPILITLRDYSHAYDLEQLVTNVVANRYKVGLAAGYKTFARLNQAGRLLLIFDGFDEMERRVSDYRTAVDNFWELAKAVCPASKVILTCRTAYFRHHREEEETLTPKRRRVSVVAGSQVVDLHGQDRFEVVHLLNFNDEDISLALQKRLPVGWGAVYQKIRDLPNLRDLASRPVLLDMITKTLSQIQDIGRINQANLYEAYVDALLKRRWSQDTDYIPPEDRLFFVQELAWEMYQVQKLGVPFSEFPKRVTKHFGLEDDPERATFFERDVRTQSYLIRDGAGNYRFAHKSFIEYFVARKMANVISVSNFEADKAINLWGTRLLTSETQSFLLPMIANPMALWRLIEATKDKTIADIGYAGGNAATLLRAKGESFVNAGLGSTVLVGADLSNADLTGADLRCACLRDVNLSGCTMERVDLREADLTNLQVEEASAAHSLAWSPNGRWLASGVEDGKVWVWDTNTGKEIATLSDSGGTVRSVCWNHSGSKLAAGNGEGLIRIWDTSNWVELARFQVSVSSVTDLRFKCAEDDLLAVAALDGTIGIYDCTTGILRLDLGKLPGGAHAIRFSPNEQYIIGGSSTGAVAVWRASSGERVAQLRGSKAPVTDFQFLLNSVDLIVFKGNQEVEVWSYLGLTTGQADMAVIWERYYEEHASFVERQIEEFIEQYCTEYWAEFEQEYALELSVEPNELRLKQLKREFVARRNPGYYDELIEWTVSSFDDEMLASDDEAYGEGMSWEDIQQLKGSLWPRTRYVGFVEYWGIHNGSRKLLRWGPQYRGRCIAILPGETYAIGGFDGRIAVWGNQFISTRGVLEGHSDCVNSLCLNPTSKWLASGSDDATVRVWDVDPDSLTFGQCLRVLKAKMNCQGMRIGNTRGLDAPAPDGKSTLRDWLIARGAME